MAFLGKVFGLLIQPVLNWLWDKLSGLLKAYLDRRKAKAEIEKKNKEVREQLEKAETKEEREDAAKNLIDKF